MELKGKVIRSTGSWSNVLIDTNDVVECKLRGNFRIKGIRSTNPVAVGDIVSIEKDAKDPTKGVIVSIANRRNYLIRRSVNLSKQTHIIAANVDQLIVLATLTEPRTSLGFIDRLLVTSEAYEIPASIVFNKADLMNPESSEELRSIREIYEKVGYHTFSVSAKDGTGLTDLMDEMKDKVSLIAGHSGVGKSTLINTIEPGLDLKVKQLSDAHLKGTHTTTFAEMFRLSFGGFIIDTPGLKEFGMVDMDDDNVGHYFPEIFKFSEHCRFNDCKHKNEPGCAVLKALDRNDIASSRYRTYLGILTELD